MQRCIDLASNGLGKVSPNPLVGAVLVYEGKIIGEGWHRVFGEAHAEVNAVDDCRKNGYSDLISRSTLFVNLEPCNHYGKTPPCTELILTNKIPEVIIGMRDPFSKVEGEGIQRLKQAGIRVTEGILKTACEELNRRFITWQTRKRPYIILKFAQSVDGFIAPKDSQGKIHWISNANSRRLVHKWRSEEDAVMAGYHTIRKDNPKLTLRDWPGRNPVRIVVDDNLSLPSSSQVLDGECPTLLFNVKKDETRGNLEFIRFNPEESLPVQVCKALKARNIQSVIVEGGRRLFRKFLDEGLWDEARIFTATQKLGDGIQAPDISGTEIRKEMILEDELRILRNPAFN